jgi:predicted branched-subunit amino acid permease
MSSITRRSEWWAGMRALAPMLLGVAPFGLIYGVLARHVGNLLQLRVFPREWRHDVA